MNKLHPTMLRTGLHQPAASFVCELGGLVLARTASMMGFIPFNATRDSGPVCCQLSVSVWAPITGPHVLAAGAPLVNCPSHHHRTDTPPALRMRRNLAWRRRQVGGTIVTIVTMGNRLASGVKCLHKLRLAGAGTGAGLGWR